MPSFWAAFYRAASVILLVAGGPFYGSAADIRPYIHDGGSYRAIVIEGVIEPGDYETFVRILRENQGHVSVAYCFSPGGDFNEAIKIGRAMRALELHSQAPMRNAAGQPECGEGKGIDQKPRDPKNCTCASAGFFMHIGAISKGGNFLAAHRPFFTRGAFGKLSEDEAKRAFDALQERASEYMRDMGVPRHIQEDVLGTPSEKSLVLDEKTVKTFFWGPLPHRHEWIKNRCSRLSDSERGRIRNYDERHQKRSAKLSSAEAADLNALQKKEDEERACSIAITKQNRIVAYEKFFQVKSTDFGHHNFDRWSQAAKYLGKSFYELMSEERFQEDRTLDLTSLGREATANAPAILLFDAPSKPRVVDSIALYSAANPSPEFVKRVVKVLEASWGVQSGGNGTTEWRWNSAAFLARLRLEPRPSPGPYLRLNISQKVSEPR